MAEPETREDRTSASATTDTVADATGVATDPADPALVPTEGATPSDNATPSDAKKRRKGISGYVWAAGIVTLLVAELYAYGHNGHVRVCVGRKGITDFAQLDKPRKGNIASGYPFCVENLNLGMYSRSDDVAKEALDVACSRAATLLRGEKSECVRRDKDWIRRVDKSTIPPWDPRLYKRLFFVE